MYNIIAHIHYTYSTLMLANHILNDEVRDFIN